MRVRRRFRSGYLRQARAAALAARAQPADDPGAAGAGAGGGAADLLRQPSRTLSRRLAAGVAGEIGVDGANCSTARPIRADRGLAPERAPSNLEMAMRFEPGAVLPPRPAPDALGPVDKDLAGAMSSRAPALHHGLGGRSGARCSSACSCPTGCCEVAVPRKRLYIGTIYMFLSGWSARRWCCSASRRSSCATRCAPSAASPAPRRPSAWAVTTGRSSPRARSRCAAPRRLQPDAGKHPPLPRPAHRDARRRLARSAHAAHASAARTGHAAAAAGAARRTWRR